MPASAPLAAAPVSAPATAPAPPAVPHPGCLPLCHQVPQVSLHGTLLNLAGTPVKQPRSWTLVQRLTTDLSTHS